MPRWPRIDAPDLLARLALSDEEFRAALAAMAGSVGPRDFTEALYERAISYPWARPATSFLLDGHEVKALDDLAAGARAGLIAQETAGRHPLLAFGSNGSPEALILKFGHLVPEQRRLLVVAGELHDFDVGASAHPTFYAAMPGTIFPSPGTRVRASVLWVTTEQFTALTWTEISYALGHVETPFIAELDGAPALDGVFGFVARLGAHRVDGEVVALAAVEARGRTARALTQEQILDDVARRAIGPGAVARDLVERVMADFGGLAAVAGPMLHETAAAFASDRWTPYPAAGG